MTREFGQGFRRAYPGHFPRSKFRYRFPKSRISDERLERAWSHVSTADLQALVDRGPDRDAEGDVTVEEATVFEARKRVLAMRNEAAQ